MIIPIRCMSCGKVIADMWTHYQSELKKRRGTTGPDNRYMIDSRQIPQTLELEIMKELGFKRPCCRKHFLTHVDLIDKI